MADIKLWGATFPDVPKVLLPTATDGQAEFVEVSGSQTVTNNGTYDVSSLAEMVVNVSGGGGGASNVVLGEFTVQDEMASQSINIPYTGSGYPIALTIYVKGGMYNSNNSYNPDWYSLLRKEAIGEWHMHKLSPDTAPTYNNTGVANQATASWIYKTNATSGNTYTRGGNNSLACFRQQTASSGAGNAVKIYSKNVLDIWASGAGSGFISGMTYVYHIIYSA